MLHRSHLHLPKVLVAMTTVIMLAGCEEIHMINVTGNGDTACDLSCDSTRHLTLNKDKCECECEHGFVTIQGSDACIYQHCTEGETESENCLFGEDKQGICCEGKCVDQQECTGTNSCTAGDTNENSDLVCCNNQWLTKVELGASCECKEQCAENQICDGVCKCGANLIEDGDGRCVTNRCEEPCDDKAGMRCQKQDDGEYACVCDKDLCGRIEGMCDEGTGCTPCSVMNQVYYEFGCLESNISYGEDCQISEQCESGYCLDDLDNDGVKKCGCNNNDDCPDGTKICDEGVCKVYAVFDRCPEFDDLENHYPGFVKVNHLAEVDTRIICSDNIESLNDVLDGGGYSQFNSLWRI